jgi:hypothetical protein
MHLQNTFSRKHEKCLSAYGGVGSILETSKGALLVEPFDEVEVLFKTLQEFLTKTIL